MGVPAWHRTPIGFFATLVAVVCGFGFVSAAQAGGECCQHKKEHVVRVPGVSVKGPSVHVSTPGVFVNKGGASVHNSFSSSGGFFAGGGGSSLGQVFFSSGGGGFVGGGSAVSTVITNLNVETEAVAVPYTETIIRNHWVEDVFVLRAVCIDDKGVPHPSSRPDPDDQVSPMYDGELFRCMAGTSMQVTLGKYAHGHHKFDNASTIICAKGEALRHRPGGALHCAPQEPRRNCNERSLLRKYGPGVKVVRLRHMEQYREQVTRTRYETSSSSSASASASASAKARASTTLTLSGGVGGN